MPRIRFGVVGLGNMGVPHASELGKGQGGGDAKSTQVRGANYALRIATARSRDFCLGAVCDVVADKARITGERMGVPHFADALEMFDSGLIDAVVIATPHYFHPPLTIAAARAGLHVVCEKPLAVTVGEARAMIAECEKNNVVLGSMLQQRTRGVMMKMKSMVDRGEVGEIFRVSMICSNWFRSQAYYNSGAWRGTWDGEGGGVLINQAPHSLDLFQWIGGMPRRVTTLLSTRAHDIEVEDTVNTLCEYGDGKVGYLYATTGEAPGKEQFMVCGEKGTLIAEGGKLHFGKLSRPLSEAIMHGPAWGAPDTRWKEITWKREPGGVHLNVLKAFAAHIRRGRKLVASGAEGINELELSNAMYISGYKHKPVDLPVKASEIDSLIGKLERERSAGRGGGFRKQGRKALRKLGVNPRDY